MTREQLDRAVKLNNSRKAYMNFLAYLHSSDYIGVGSTTRMYQINSYDENYQFLLNDIKLSIDKQLDSIYKELAEL